MKGLHKIIYPFAPDQSGAVSVLYELGGLLVVCDAGGCAGNICGFDEPRWGSGRNAGRSAVFSAGLRDMDAILGRDTLLVEKMARAAAHMQASFAAIIGTPVPATIATDYRAVQRMAEERCGMPVLAIETNGIRWYDQGAEAAYLALFKTFAEDTAQREEGLVGVLGATPLDLGTIEAEALAASVRRGGASRVVCYGMGSTLADVRAAGRAERNLVVAPSGLKAARYLKKRFGTPYSWGLPQDPDVAVFAQAAEAAAGAQRILIVHQQAAANALRNRLREETGAAITCATWFMQKREAKETGDFVLRDEDHFLAVLDDYDVLIGDPSFAKALRHWEGTFVPMSHFAVSGHLKDVCGEGEPS